MNTTTHENTVLSARSQRYLEQTEAEFRAALRRAVSGGAPIVIQTTARVGESRVPAQYHAAIEASNDLVITITNGVVSIAPVGIGFALDADARAWIDDLTYDWGLNALVLANLEQAANTRTLIVTGVEQIDPAIVASTRGVRYEPNGASFRAVLPPDLLGVPVTVLFNTLTHERSISYPMFERICLS